MMAERWTSFSRQLQPERLEHPLLRPMASLQLPVVIGTPDRAIEGPIRLHQFGRYFPGKEPFLDMRISIKCARRGAINSHQREPPKLDLVA
jgi:hypothetical protein